MSFFKTGGADTSDILLEKYRQAEPIDWGQAYSLALGIFLIITFLCVLICIRAERRRPGGMRRSGNPHKVISVIIAIIYSIQICGIILALHDSLFGSSGLPSIAPYQYYRRVDMKNYMRLIFPSACAILMTLSVVLRNKGRSILSFIVQFLPFLILSAI